MLLAPTIIFIFCGYMGLLFCLALWTQHLVRCGRSPVNNPIVYSLSLAVYCSSWTFFGSVGQATTNGLLFLSIYLGPTLMVVCWGGLLRRMVLLKNNYRITSLADFISTRYEKSEGLAALVTLIALLGITPYVALQIKSVMATFAVISTHGGQPESWVNEHVGVVVVGLMIMFTIIFGVRRLEPTERHEGIVMAVAAESLVKLVALVAIGVYVVYNVFNGLDDIFRRLPPNLTANTGASPLTWVAYLVVAANAMICLPRQFHVAVLENQSPNHIRWAMWLFPLYLFVINLFIYPIAMAGLLRGLPVTEADTFVLQLPLQQGDQFMALLVFMGGFSAATSMILISSMTMATMISNHLLLPLVEWFPRLAIIERRLLQCRWLAVAGFIIMGYWFEQIVGERFRLADIGLISFTAMLQLAPPLFGGLFWRGGQLKGAYWGLMAGFLTWAYTMLLPVVAQGAGLWPGLLRGGPLGIALLKPQALLGLVGLEPVTHAVFWSLLLNTCFYVIGSLLAAPTQEGLGLAEAFVGVTSGPARRHSSIRRQAHILLKDKERRIQELLTRYFGPEKAGVSTEKCLQEADLAGQRIVSINELAALYDQVEKALAGSIGSAAARRTLARAEFFTPLEAEELREMYAEILADLRARPEDLKRQIDFHQEREALIELHAEELEGKVTLLEKEISRRLEVEAHLRESEERYRMAIENSSDGVVMIQDGIIFWGNLRLAEILGYRRRRELIGQPLALIVHPDDRERVLGIARDRQSGRPAPARYDFKGLKKDGTPLYIAVSATTVNYHGQTMNMAYLRDVTSRRLSEEEIRQLSRRLIVGIEEERRRLAADLHDEFGQALTGLHLRVESLIGSLSPDQDKIRSEGQKVLKLIEQLAENLRGLCGELRPDMLDHLGLVPTVESYVEDFRERMPGLEVFFRAQGFKNRKMAPQVAIALYRILQEALNNIAKHSGADRITIQLTYSHPQVIMIVNDNGRGFATDRGFSPSGGSRGGLGLVSMKERAAAAGGKIEIRSTPGKGTTIRVTLPATEGSVGGREDE